MRDPKQIIKKALLTEKGNQLRQDRNEYVFLVDRDSNKVEVRQAIEHLFKVKVKEVHTMVQHGKIKTFGRYKGPKPDWKKAVVRLAKDNKIELFEGV
ncbi:MAG: 50S ribosomal protein L23 [candidate division Zixibacteria bacterium RBG_16_50_21]|nr:MAG: 50S ribosomal protein L23 [candidate division Zixibacteria bacterium RBG_16_50_21]